MNRLDAHIHLMERGWHGDQSVGAELASYEDIRSTAGITRAMVVGYEGEATHRHNNDYLQSLIPNHDWITALAYVDPAAAPRTLGAQRAHGFTGFALYSGDDPHYFPSLSRAVRTELGHAPLLSINARPGSLAYAEGFLRTTPSAAVLISHLGLPGLSTGHTDPRAALQQLLSLSAVPNVFVKLSAFYTIDPVAPHAAAAEYAAIVVDSFGADRVVWGSDFAPVADYATTMETFHPPAWFTELFSPDELAAVLGDTLTTILDSP